MTQLIALVSVIGLAYFIARFIVDVIRGNPFRILTK
jgi:hypothetical protein